MTQPNPSPNFFMQQDEKTRSPRGRMSLWKNVSMAMQGLRQRNVHRLILKSGTLQNTCSTRLKKWRQTWGKVLSCASSVWWTTFWKVQEELSVAMLKKNDLHESVWQPVVNCDKSRAIGGDPISIVTPVMSWSEDLFNADHRTHGIWVVFQDMKPLKSILRKSSDMKKPIQRVKITKAIARRTKIRDQNSSLGYSEEFKNWMKRSGSRKFILLEHKIIYFFMNSYWSKDLREAHHKSQWNGRIDDISGFYIRHHCQDTEIAKWKELYEWFKRFSGCWINTLWKFQRDQSTSVFHTSSNSWMDVETFFVTPKGWSKTTKTNFCHINHKNLLVGENLDRHSTTRLFAYRLLMVEETNHSSSLSWLSTSRRWWIVWILENQWQSSETFPASLGWRKVTNRMEEEDKKKNFSVVPILQEQLCTSEFSKVILDATLWILHHKTMSLFWTVSSSSLTMLDMQSNCIPSSIQGWYQEVKIWATDRPCSFFLWILWTKNASILTRSSWKHRALHIHAGSMEETSASYVLDDINIALKKGLKYQTQSNAIILYETLPAYCIPKVVRMETWEVVNEKVFASLRLPPKISLQHDWMK